MHLWITVQIRDENNNLSPIDFESDNLHQGGSESSRYEFWGHPIMKELGLVILPMLGDGFNLVVEGDELDELAHEALTIRENVSQIAAITQHNVDFIAFYTDNILHAVGQAKDLGGIFKMGGTITPSR